MDDQQINDNDDEQIKEDAFRPDKGGMFSPAHDEEVLPEDNTPPAAPADDVNTNDPQVSADNPQTDTNIETEQAYDEGTANASEVNAELESPDERARPLDDQQ